MWFTLPGFSGHQRIAVRAEVAMDAGDRLREIRNRMGVSTREVAQMSKRIADAEHNEEFLISSPWLTQLENKTTLPSVYKLFTLASIYGLTYTYLLSLYGVDLKKVILYHGQMPLRKTHLATLDSSESPKAIDLPIRFDAGLNLNQTALLSRMIDTWGRVPVELIKGLNLRHRLYGFVGLEDYTLYPLIRPGSFVEINPESIKPRHPVVRAEFDRPVYFIDVRVGYACAWCEIVAGNLLLHSHPLSPCGTRIVKFPEEAKIIGEVTGVAMRIGTSPELLGGEFPRMPMRAQDSR